MPATAAAGASVRLSHRAARPYSPDPWSGALALNVVAHGLAFLVAAKAFVRGRYEVVRGLTAELGWARVAPEVRALFRDPAGVAVFAPGHD